MTIRELIQRREEGLEDRQSFIASIAEFLNDLNDAQLETLAMELLTISDESTADIDESTKNSTLYQMYQDSLANYRAGKTVEMDFDADDLGMSEDQP